MPTKIAFIHNLPDGGAIRMLNQIVDRYKNKFEIDYYSIGELARKNISGINNISYVIKPWKGFVFYNLWIILKLPMIHKQIADSVDWSKYKIIFFSHDYFTKSPYLMRYVKNKNRYYLCQESQREYYEPLRYHANSVLDRIAIAIRYPIKWIDQTNVKYASKLFCNSKYSKHTLENIYKKKFEIIYPGVNEKFFCPSSDKKENLILCVGGINKTKNQLFLIKALGDILKKYRLILVGDGKRNVLKKISAMNGNISIKKNITDLELRRLYRRAKLTCITAYREPFGLSSIESQSCGTPVITVNDGGTKETVLNNVTGYICKFDEKEFNKQIKKILSKSTSMGIAARQNILKKWTIENTLKPLDKYIQL